jgi:hypothetical protein
MVRNGGVDPYVQLVVPALVYLRPAPLPSQGARVITQAACTGRQQGLTLPQTSLKDDASRGAMRDSHAVM